MKKLPQKVAGLKNAKRLPRNGTRWRQDAQHRQTEPCSRSSLIDPSWSAARRSPESIRSKRSQHSTTLRAFAWKRCQTRIYLPTARPTAKRKLRRHGIGCTLETVRGSRGRECPAADQERDGRLHSARIRRQEGFRRTEAGSRRLGGLRCSRCGPLGDIQAVEAAQYRRQKTAYLPEFISSTRQRIIVSVGSA